MTSTPFCDTQLFDMSWRRGFSSVWAARYLAGCAGAMSVFDTAKMSVTDIRSRIVQLNYLFVFGPLDMRGGRALAFSFHTTCAGISLLVHSLACSANLAPAGPSAQRPLACVHAKRSWSSSLTIAQHTVFCLHAASGPLPLQQTTRSFAKLTRGHPSQPLPAPCVSQHFDLRILTAYRA